VREAVLASKPEGGVAEGELEFAAVFAEEEGMILAAKKSEVRCEEFAESGEGIL